jgi:hypothetical protein
MNSYMNEHGMYSNYEHRLIEQYVAEHQRRLELIQPYIRLLCTINGFEQPTWIVEPDGSWTKIKRGLSEELLAQEREIHEAIHYTMNYPPLPHLPAHPMTLDRQDKKETQP